jgi:aspartyl-tRNA(Asn)/glutamyl-tRNA(Gln) amidotransferase subunit A
MCLLVARFQVMVHTRFVVDGPWGGDACSLVDEFRAGRHSPVEELEVTLAAIDASELNAFCHVDAEVALERARVADVSLPFGGVPVGVKEREPVAGWPSTEASLVFADRVGSFDSTVVERLRRGGANLIGQTTSSEFGGLNVSVSRLHGVTRNPWDMSRTTGGSSAGSSAAVAGGLVTIATGSDGGGSIRIPAGFCGLVGMKGTGGRIPRGPRTVVGALTVVAGCVARSVRDVARWYDVTGGYDRRDPYSLPRVENWERDLDQCDLKGLRVAILPDLGRAVIRPEIDAMVQAAGEALAADAGLTLTEIAAPDLPEISVAWVMSNLAVLQMALGDRWPDCKGDLTAEMAFGMELASELYDLEMAAKVEADKIATNEGVAEMFDQVDVVICATNPDVAYPAEVTLNTRVGEVTVGGENNLTLTGPFNISGNPAIAVPIGELDGAPVSMQLVTHHHCDAILFDLARVVERERPWPLVAPVAPS